MSDSPKTRYTADYVSLHENNWRSLLGHLKGKDAVRMLEIGSYEGRSAEWFLANILTGRGSRIVCVDSFPDAFREKLFDSNLAAYGDKVRKVCERSAVALNVMLTGGMRGEFDAIYVDGSHRAADVLLDAVLAWGLLKPGGTLILDDYEWGQGMPMDERPKLGIDALLSVLKGCGVVHVGWQMVLRKAMTDVISSGA